ncbi:MAG TPA: STAS domain-containing protein [Labilithrix sp.]
MSIILASSGNSRVDARFGDALLASVDKWIAEGATAIVLELGPQAVIDFAGARALGMASKRLGRGRLRVTGLGARSRTLLRSLGLSEDIALFEWWTEAVAQAA